MERNLVGMVGSLRPIPGPLGEGAGRLLGAGTRCPGGCSRARRVATYNLTFSFPPFETSYSSLNPISRVKLAGRYFYRESNGVDGVFLFDFRNQAFHKRLAVSEAKHGLLAAAPYDTTRRC